ncbi:MAG TPA: ATP-binding protein [Nodosilinea sp.]|nr:ATP-binding protein [Nodosilinea sp.]
MPDFAAVQGEVQQYRRCIDGLLLYQAVFETAPGRCFVALLEALKSGEPSLCLRAYGAWFGALARGGESWPHHLLRQIASAENPFTLQAERRELAALPTALVEAARHDLARLQALHDLNSERVAGWVQAVTRGADLPDGLSAAAPVVWACPAGPLPLALPALAGSPGTAWGEAVADLAEHYRRHGVGVFARYQAFTWQGGKLAGIAEPDPIRLEQLTAYDHPRQQLVQNTLALLRGYPALNVLLYGSRGAGKSSLVKALANEYAPQGLRLIEVAKADLRALPEIVGEVRSRPQRFIIFVDDLSFEEDDDTFKALKVVLEGGTTARPANVVVYATSNRRHLVREYFSDRPRPSDQDEVQAWDTLQEKLSFSDRFGLTLTFEPADQPTYLAIVRHLAAQAQIPIAAEDLTARALQWATRHNGRSGRSARQFIDWLAAEVGTGPLT